MDVAKATMGHGWPTVAGLWSGDGVSEPSRSEGRMKGRRFWLLLPAKVTRPGGRNQEHQQKRGKPEQAPEQPTSQQPTHKLASPVSTKHSLNREEPFSSPRERRWHFGIVQAARAKGRISAKCKIDPSQDKLQIIDL
ncbi:hypothetical protein OU800_04855 [Pseudomonas sp. GOM7]|uniref:hypothetical protein n=1 Tax=Pseudomonas sp. GOM7 TaxID=2998079 RepID=UPI00227CBAB2|nr:hypothetical protein [Pseudomonas sp. GOM7]WAJ38569.1 hypothetical protein OU800_04855 [Pseudomonas sp. GOM7]